MMLEVEHDNFRAALEWLVPNDPESAWGLAGALGNFWVFNGHYIEGRHWLEQVLALPHPETPSTARVDVLAWAGLLAHYQGDHGQATSRLSEALVGARALDDARRIGETLLTLGVVAEDSGAYDEAAAYLEESLEVHRRLNDRHLESLTLVHLGIVSYGKGDLEQAEAQCVAARALTRGAGGVTTQFLVPLTLGHIATELGALQQAAIWYREVLALFDDHSGLASMLEHGHAEAVARTVAGVALLAAAQGQAGRAARLFGMAEAARAEVGLVLTLPESAAYERATEAARSEIGEHAFADAVDEGRRTSAQQVLGEVETVLGEASSHPGSSSADHPSGPHPDGRV
jgi:tetratricopeptide (TPR) repeat protein